LDFFFVTDTSIIGMETMVAKENIIRLRTIKGKVGTLAAAGLFLLLTAAQVPASCPGIADDVEYRLNRHYSEYSEAGWSLFFSHSIETFPNYLENRMVLRDEPRVNTRWKNRSRMRFDEFVERIGRLASQLAEKDVRVIIVDRESKVLASYEFIRERNLLKPAIVGFSRFDEAIREDYPLTTTELEDLLDLTFDIYEGEDSLFLFDYGVVRTRDALVVSARAENFSIEDEVWKERDVTAFEDFVDRIWILVRDRMGEESTVIVRDRHGELLTTVTDVL